MAATNFNEVIEGKEQPSLKAIAIVLEVPQQRLYSVAKQPKAGEVYDAHIYNWDAISKFIAKRIGKDGDAYATFEEVYDEAIKTDAELGASDKRRGPRGSSKVEIDLGDGKKMPARRKELKVGDKVVLKGDDKDYEVVMLTDTHTVMQIKDTTVLSCLSNWTMNQKYVAPKAEAAEVVVEVHDEEDA